MINLRIKFLILDLKKRMFGRNLKARFSTYAKSESTSSLIGFAFKSSLTVVAGGLIYTYASDSRAAIYPYLVMPIMHTMDAEQSHRWSIKLAKWGIIPRDTQKEDSSLQTRVRHISGFLYMKTARSLIKRFGAGQSAIPLV
jgi:hypothetical protein